jgi:hypothetical protein
MADRLPPRRLALIAACAAVLLAPTLAGPAAAEVPQPRLLWSGTTPGAPPARAGTAALPAAAPAPAAPARSPSKRGQTMERLGSGVWIEGPGFEVTYGGNYDGCARRCLASDKCVMIEYYRPERKCNLYSTIRPRRQGGASDVAIRS